MATSSRPTKPFHRYITLDTLIHLLQLPLPIAWTLPLLSLAQTPDLRSFRFRALAAYALALTLLHLLRQLNQRLAYGRPRKLDWSEEVVVVTGGASGLGHVVAGLFGMRGASVAVLDVREPEGGVEGLGEGVRFYECDVGDLNQVEGVRERVVKDLGTPTILINNAGIVNGLPLLALSPAAIERNFRVNLLSHYHTIQAFLPDMLNRPLGGTIVTVSSVLGNTSASHLSDYAAAKAGLMAMHTALRAELSSMAALPDAAPGAKNIRTVLVKPGQLSTQMFSTLETPSNFFGPVVDVVELARAMVKMIDEGRSGVIAMPLYAQWIELLDIMPASVQRALRWMAGVDRAMLTFEPVVKNA